jgi:cytochrome c biogenesis protein CcdA
MKLGTLYALGHGAVVIALGVAALAFGAILPDWLDPIMGRIVGLTLVLLGVWVLYSVYRYARGGEVVPPRAAAGCSSSTACAMRGAGWALDLHGHEHVEPLEMSSYGPKTGVRASA